MKKLKTWCLAFLVAGGTASGQTITWYVSPTGSDQAEGTLQKPFRTLQKAIDHIGTQTPSSTQHYRILMRGGTYPLSRAVTIKSVQGSLAIESYQQEKPVLSGNKKITGTWKKSGPNLWKIKAGDRFNQLFVAGQRAIRARFPDEGKWIEPDSIQLDINRLVFTGKIPEKFARITGAELHTTGYWHYIRQAVKTFDPVTHAVITRQYPGPECSSRKIARGDRAHFENSLLFVDAENEWFLDAEAGELYFHTAKDPNAMRFEYPAITTLMQVEGSREALLDALTLKGITFTGTEWEMSPVERKGIQAGFWGTTKDKPVYAPGAALMLDWVVNARISHCTFRLLGEGAITLGAGCAYNNISGNLFDDVGSNVVQVGYRASYLGKGHPLHHDHEDPAEVSHHNLIRNNHFRNFATTDLGGVGIWVGYSHHNQIDHNLLEDFPYSGISVGWYWGGETDPVDTHCHSNTIAWNELRKGMKYLSDGAAIYLVGNQPGTRITDNWIHQIGGGYAINSGIYIDEGGANMEISRNYIYELTNPREAYPVKLHKNVIPTMQIYHNGGVPVKHPIVAPHKNYLPSKYADVPLSKPADVKRYGLR